MTPIDTNYNELRITDAHVHFWDLDKMTYPWLNKIPLIQQSFELAAYKKATSHIPIQKIIFVQCECIPDEYLIEIDYITTLAKQEKRIQGIVPYFPLEHPLAESLFEEHILNVPLIKGIRRLQEHPQPLYSRKDFIRGLDLLKKNNLSFDLGVKASQLHSALKLVDHKPEIRYMLDHFGKPDIKTRAYSLWKQHIIELSQHKDTYCKLSGLITESDWNHWKTEDLKPYVDTVFEFFGSNRVCFGSDWPVVTLAGDYSRWLETALSLCEHLSEIERDKVFYQNALDFYQIN